MSSHPVESHKMKSARGTLEKIAKGMPVSEATGVAEQMPDKEAMTRLLSESNDLLLELRDMRLLVTAIATQSADTPLGNETKLEALRMIRDMKTDGLSPEQVTSVTKIQEEIRALSLPDVNPSDSALIPVISAYNEAHPDAAVPKEGLDQIASGNKDTATAVAGLMQSSPDLAADIWKQLTGVDGFSGLRPTPTNILQLAGIPTTPENMAKANEMFGVISKLPLAKQRVETDKLLGTAMLGGLMIMFFTQLATGEGGGGH